MKTPYSERREVVNTVLVRERDRLRRRELGLVALAVLPLAFGLAGYTWVHLETRQTGYRIASLERELHRLDRKCRELTLEVSYRASAERVERIATTELGMREQTLDQTLHFEEAR